MLFSTALVLTLLAGACSAAPAASLIEHEKRNLHTADASKWIKRSRAPTAAKVPVRIALKQRNLDRGHDILMDIADPNSPNFGKHLTPQEIGALFQPHQDSVSGVRTWLVESGIAKHRHSLSASNGWIAFDATIAELEALLQTEYHVFEHSTTGNENVAADRYHLPGHVHPHVDFISPTVTYEPLKKYVKRAKTPSKKSKGPPPLPPSFVKSIPALNGQPEDLSACSKLVTPACIRAMYGMPASNEGCTEGNQLGLVETENPYNQLDLDAFYSTVVPSVPNGTHPKVNSIDGGVGVNNTLAGEGDEGMLDIELSLSLVYPQETIVYEINDPNIPYTKYWGDVFLDALDASFCTYKGGDNSTFDPVYPDTRPGGYNQTEMCGTYKPTNVISASYGNPEVQFTAFYQQRQCYEYMKLGLAGTTIVFSSGDYGVAQAEGCIGNGTIPFNPTMPDTCPYVTSVGATKLPAGACYSDLQVAAGYYEGNGSIIPGVDGFYSSGGFSNLYKRPAYQDAAVKKYLSGHAPNVPKRAYNASGRAFPDVSAIGQQIALRYDGYWAYGNGTSASAPIFASMITLINEDRIAAGKKPVGFLNPTLYQNPEAFTDVTEGNNRGCGTMGFSAAEGWDPVTGMGTPRFPKLREVLMALP